MPNWVRTKVFFKCDDEEFKNILERYRTDDNDFSFEKIIPRPADKEEDWYNWNIANWGTKWDTNDVYISTGIHTIEFETAWCVAEPVLTKLSEQLPNIRIKIAYADEDLGSGCGAVELMDGEIISVFESEDEKEDFVFACYVWGFEDPSTVYYDVDKTEGMPDKVSYDDYEEDLESWCMPYKKD